MIELQSFCNISSSFSTNIIATQAKYDKRERERERERELEREREREITYYSLVKVWLSFSNISSSFITNIIVTQAKYDESERERDYLL